MSRSISRREFSQLLAGSLAAPAVLHGQNRRPNILFLMTDEHRGDALGCMGHPLVKTPHFDQLAADGVLFRHFFTSSPVCSPARVSAFTGRYPKTHGVVGNGQPIRAGEILLPELLRKHGYRTGLGGKLHFHLTDARGLFDVHQEFPGRQYTAYLAATHPEAKGNPQFGTQRPPKGKQGFRMWWIGTSEVPEKDFPTTWVADRAIDFIRQGDSRQPWFCFASFLKPHSPFVLPRPWSARYSPDEVTIPRLPEQRPTPPTAENRDRHYIVAGQEQTLRRITALYYGAISYLDAQVGRILEALRASGQYDNTIIVFTADHGNSLGDHGRVFKGTPYESAIHVPGIFHYPAAIPRGRVADQLADTTCIMPTLLDLAGFGPADGFESPSARGILERDDAPWSDAIFTEMLFRTIRTARWKLTNPAEHPTWEWQLFDLENDPGEQTNLHGRPEAAAVQQGLNERLEKWYRTKPAAVRI